MKNILLGVTGGIAAYKAIELTSKLTQAGYNVRVMMTEHAQQFVTPLSFQAISRQPVYTNTFIEENPAEIQHISLGDWADLIIIAPATANTISKLAHGLADDIVSSTLLATSTPKWIAPAMNVNMYNNPRIQHNMMVLAEDGYRFIEPGEGFLACGYVAKGRMAEPLDITDMVQHHFSEVHTTSQNASQHPSYYKNKRVLITAGPTVEVIDPVRFVSNRASGKMGYAIAEVLVTLGANVTLISGPTAIKVPDGVTFISVQSAQDMFDAVYAHYQTQDIIFKTAAVSDYTPCAPLEHKMKKQDGNVSVEFKRTIDILKFLGEEKTHQKLVGFAAETQNVAHYALDKLKRKRADVIIANNVGDTSIGFNSDENEVTMYFDDGHEVPISKGAKIEVARRILNTLEGEWQ